MGGGSIIGPVADTIGEKLGKVGAKEIGGWFESFQGFLNRSDTGKMLRGVLEDYEFKTHMHGQELIRQGLNPEDAALQAKDRYQRLFFGKNKENIARAVNIARQEKGGAYATALTDNLSIYFHEQTPRINTPKTSWRMKAGESHESPYHSVAEAEQKLRHAMSYMFTSRIAIPHLSQLLNSVLVNGFGNTARGVADVLADKESAKEFTLMSGALFDESLYEFRNLSHNKPTILTKIFHQPFFSKIRQMQLIVSAIAGKYSAEGEFANLMRGRDAKGAYLQLKALGLNPDTLIKQGKLTEGDLARAAFQSARDTMFIRSELQTPTRWNATPLSRALFMYKHYTFNEGRLIKDVIARSWDSGPERFAKTMATIGVLFPMVGEVVKTLELTATGTDPTGERAKEDRQFHTGNDAVDEYLDALGYAAGFGIFYSQLRAAQRNALASYFAGPILGFLGELGQDAYQIAFNQKFTPAGRTALRRIPVVGSAISNYVFPPRTKKHSKDDE